MKPEQSLALPEGVAIMALTGHSDRRGDLTEFFRNEWVHAPPPFQWLVSRTEANALRGVHAHAHHWDDYFVVSGKLVVGLHGTQAVGQRSRGRRLHRNERETDRRHGARLNGGGVVR